MYGFLSVDYVNLSALHAGRIHLLAEKVVATFLGGILGRVCHDVIDGRGEGGDHYIVEIEGIGLSGGGGDHNPADTLLQGSLELHSRPSIVLGSLGELDVARHYSLIDREVDAADVGIRGKIADLEFVRTGLVNQDSIAEFGGAVGA